MRSERIPQLAIPRLHAAGYTKVTEENFGQLYQDIGIGCVSACVLSAISALVLGLSSGLLACRFGLAKKAILPLALGSSIVGLGTGLLPLHRTGRAIGNTYR